MISNNNNKEITASCDWEKQKYLKLKFERGPLNIRPLLFFPRCYGSENVGIHSLLKEYDP